MSSSDTKAKALAVLQEHIVSRGLRMTRQRRLIAEVMFETSGHVNIDELYALVKERDGSVGYATMYRTLKLLTEAGLTQAASFGDGPTRFEAAIDRHHHDHLICVDCGRIIEFENPEIERLQAEVCRAHGFTMHDHKLDIHGHCNDADCPHRPTPGAVA